MPMVMAKEQYVCLVCGYNMVGFHPETCPFCGAHRTRFITSAECSDRYRVIATPVNKQVTRLNSDPALGYEHAAYRIDTGDTACWIDCPSSFDSSLDPVEAILFTHHHFLGASNLYREHFPARVHIHHADADNDLSRPFPFDEKFERDFSHHGIEACHIDGHTPGFTLYIFEETLFLCDYVFCKDGAMQLNPFGPADRTIAAAGRIREIVAERSLTTVCGYDYVVDFAEWWRMFKQGPPFAGF